MIFVEEPIEGEDDDRVPRLDLTPRPGGIRVAVPVLPANGSAEEAIGHQRDLIDGLLADEEATTRVLWYYTPMAVAFSGHLRADLTIYDNMDELSAFRGASAEMLAREDELFARADLVFTGGMSLYEAKRGRHPSLHPFPSSIDVAHFGLARGFSGPEPEDQRAIPRPRIGFFGVVDERMNTDLVAEIAAIRPDLHFVMIGPVVKIDPETLPEAPNIHWLGLKPYSELPRYLAGWDAGFMPFALNEATRFISPTKTPEYLAAGLPLVSTPIVDVVRPYGDLGLVDIAGSASEFASCLDRALERERGPWLRRVDAYLAGQSWDLTWEAMRALMRQRLTPTFADNGRPAARAAATPSPVASPAP